MVFDTANVVKKGIILSLLTTIGFVWWATSVDLSAASIARGVLVVESKRKQVQHLEGGWVKQVYVKEGQSIKVGDVLLELSNSKAEADFQRLMLKSISLDYQKRRLNALLAGKNTVDWTFIDDGLGVDTVDKTQIVANVISSEQLQFQQAMLKLELTKGQYTQRKALLDEQIRGGTFQRRAIARQRALLKEEIDMTQGLVKKGYVSKTRMLELKRAAARVDAELAEVTAETEVNHRQLKTLEQTHQAQLLELKQTYSSQLAQIQKESRDISEALKAATDVKSRVTIRSEHNGTVVGLNVASVGGVVNPGDVLMEIVPDSDELIIEALIPPQDIDVVRVGQQAKVRLSAYNVRKTPPVDGEVTYIAADRLSGDTNEQQTGYMVKVKLGKDALNGLENIELYPGMQTEVFIVLEQRTLWDYLTAPLTVSYYRAMREV
ncbi:HlyD family type I secretion periplasmic adaptor subunit [Vibrio nomapromontoriensis]|uniref:HlyD family type I secretion periplasmic adaptor subunit n=1 Tax=Vibrio nomapromontoriensis TaxID=2910246 RepID=UPI003D0E8463